MSTSPERTPKYRHYKPKNLGVVRIDGHDHYLGRFNSPESFEKYHRLLAERYAHGPATPAPSDQPKAATEILTIDELCLGYYQYAEKYYVKNGKITNQVRLIRLSLKVLRRLYGGTLAKDFGPLALEACQGEFVRQGLSRGECNRRTNLIKGAFRWGVKKQIVSGELWYGLKAVGGLKEGRCEAHDPPPVVPVPEAIVERTIEHLSPTVAAMVRLQLASAMRPGETVTVRARDLNMAGAIWEYQPLSHKGEHHAGKSRVIMLGPKAQEVIRPFLTLDISGYLFSPKRAVDEQNAALRESRKTPLYPSHVRHQAKRRKARGRRPLGEHYDVNGYRIAVGRACDRAFPHPTLSEIRPKDLTEEQKADLKAWRKAHRWHPHQLRHTAASSIRRRYGAEAAQTILGHAELNTTEIYAERDVEMAKRIMGEIG